ncbi:MAG: hypothetical protein NW217_00225 [Hyphomicrobiaceae bacterium]|nr:hypothetical protein [Hyphomicrobiaceae bacterium]
MAKRSRKADKVGGLDQWVDFLRFSLADICVRGDWDDFGMFRFLNRVMFLSRKPLVFAIHHLKSHSYVQMNEVTAFDPFYRSSIIRALEDTQLVTSLPRIHGSAGSGGRQQFWQIKVSKDGKGPENGYMIRMFDTNNYLLIFELVEAGSGATGRAAAIGRAPVTRFVPVAKHTKLGQFFEKVFMPFDGKDGRMKISERIEPHFQRLRQAGSYRKADDQTPENIEVDPEYLATEMGKLSKHVERVVDEQYVRLCKSPLLKSYLEAPQDASKGPANIFFFAKSFSRTSTRFGHYFYDPMLVLGDEQLKRLRYALERVSPSDLIDYPVPEYHDRFWNICQTDHERIIDELRSPFPRAARLFTENVLMSGASMVSPNVFERGNIGWVQKDGASDREQDAAYFRLACLHYILQLGSPKKPADASELSIMSVPMRCSGGIWLCASFLRENKGGSHGELVDQTRFHESYCIYHSLLREAERRTRRRAKELYLSLVSDISGRIFTSMAARHRAAAVAGGLDDAALEDFNEQTLMISRAFPFPWHVLTNTDGMPDLGGKPFVDAKCLKVLELREPFFDRLSLRSFVGAETLRSVVLYQIDRLSAEMRSLKDGQERGN